MIRQAVAQDLLEIARIHCICFPESYLTQLGKHGSLLFRRNLLEDFYREYLNDNPELFLVAENPDKGLIGFCMGYYLDNDHQVHNFIHNNRFRIIGKTIVLLLTGNKPTWAKMLSRLKHKAVISDWTIVNDKYEEITNQERGDLLSVCVLPAFRGKGHAQEMMEQFLSVMKSRGRKLCLLSVKTENARARRYYERNGFELYRTRGEDGLTYMKLLV